jgi:hypothetical protein
MKSLIKGYGREKRLGYTGLDNRLTDGSEDVSLTNRLHSTPQKHFFLFLVLISVRG